MTNNFFINRLRRMSVAEILYRVGQKARNTMEKALLGRYRFDMPLLEEPSILKEPAKLFSAPVFLADNNNPDVRKILEKADRLCENRFDIFALKDFQIHGEVDYHTDYKSGRSAPADVFGKSINYRDSDRIGDIKYIWEMSRHLFLVPLALAYVHTKQSKYLEKFEQLLSGWLEQNPFMLGVNWASSLELGIRLINWTVCWHLLEEYVSPELRKRWLDCVYQHCWFITRNLSRFSSANNHLIGEVAGLFIASTAMPQFKDSHRWREKARRILIRESVKQNYPDGVNKEQAIAYQKFVLDFLVLSGLVGQANGISFSEGYWGIIGKMQTYLAAMEDVSGNLPKIGDEDDGLVVDPLLLSIAGISSSDISSTGISPANIRPLCTGATGGIYSTHIHPDSGRLPDAFKDGGYYILGTDFGTPTEQKLIFDCGSLGYLSLAAHGHADALAVIFSAGGSPIFIDPGTYAYHADKKWRNYFRSTAAHNTVRIDGVDQSMMAGNFMWSSKAEAKIVEHESLIMAKGMHTGYNRLKDSVLHTRTVRYTGKAYAAEAKKDRDAEKDKKTVNDKETITDKETIGFDMGAGVWEVEDHIQCEGPHLAEMYYHLHPDCRIEEASDEGNNAAALKIRFSGGICQFEHDTAMTLEIYHGNEEPPLGWYSPSYDVKVPTATLKLSVSIKGSIKIKTRFSIMFNR